MAGLVAQPVDAVGSAAWMRQHLVVQRLNLLAHDAVARDSDNYVLEQLVSHDKLGVMCHELLVVEAWRERVLGDAEVLRHVAGNFGIRGYHAAFHEAAIMNLLEVVLYHDYAAQACGDLLVELVDYCVRRVRWLIAHTMRSAAGGEEETGEDGCSGGGGAAGAAGRARAREVARAGDSPETAAQLGEFCRQLFDVEWRCSVAAVGVLRYLSEHVASLPLGVLTRLIDTHDLPVLVVPLIENPPWTRRSAKGQWEKLRDNAWGVVEPRDLLLLTPAEAQPWLVLFNLLCEGSVRQRYPVHSFRKEQILRVRKYLNATLVDQLPVLADLQRVLDELVLMDAPAATAGSSSGFFVLEQVAEVRERMLKETDWPRQRQRAREVVFKGKESPDDPLVMELAGLYGDSDLEALLSNKALLEEPRVDRLGKLGTAGAGTRPGAGSKPGAGAHRAGLLAPAAAPAAPAAPSKQPRFPKAVVLQLQTGAEVELVAVSTQGTEQTTSKGAFSRFQLQLKAGTSKMADENTPTINISVPTSLTGAGAVLKMRVLASDGQAEEIFSQPLKPVAGKAETWEKLGSLSQGVLAQVQCTYDAVTGDIALGTAFLSLRA